MGRRSKSLLESAPAGNVATSVVAHWLIRSRWVFVVVVLLPASTLLRAYRVLRAACRTVCGSSKAHEGRVRRIREEIARWRGEGAPGLLCTARKSWMSVTTRRRPYKQQETAIRLDLHHVLEVDLHREVVRTEPEVSIRELTRRLIPAGWTLPVVPELESLTVGGLILGYGIESSSHKYGLFSDIVESCEVVLGDGRVVHASRSENRDLYHALPWSYGALGFLTAVELRIVPCRPYVRLNYEPVYGLAAACARLTEEVSKEHPADFIEAVVFAPGRSVVMTGTFEDQCPPNEVNEIGRWFKPWFHKHCESFLERGEGTECIPLGQYYHRYSRSIFWEGELIVPFGNHPLCRLVLGWMMPPEISLLRLTQGRLVRSYYENQHVTQDVLVPLRHLEETVKFFHDTFECYPLWLCPHRNYHREPGGLLPSGSAPYEMFVDVGAWYVPGAVVRGEPYDARAAVRGMEAFARAHRGVQCLYAITEMTRDEYREMFDCTLYDRVREKYGAQGVFMDAYDKVRRPAR